jgi:outer membrane protein
MRYVEDVMRKLFITSLALTGALVTVSDVRAEAPPSKAPAGGDSAEASPTPLEEAPLPGAVPKGALKAVPGGLVADQVASAAMKTSHEVRAKDADVAAAEAAAKQAWLNYFPRLSGAVTYTRLSPVTLPPIGALPDGTPITLPVFLNNTSFVGTLAVPLTDLLLRIPQAYASAKNATNAARYTAEAARLQIGTDARVTYYNWVRTRLQILVAQLALEQAKSHLAIVVAHESPADIARVESQVASMDLVVEKARNYAAILEDRLRTIMHDASGKPYELGENIGDELAPFPKTELSALWEEARANRLEVKALGEMVESNRQQARAAKAGAYPRLDAVGNVTAANPNQRIFPPVDEFRGTWDVSLRLSWSPNDMASSLQGGNAVDARQASFESQREALLDGLRSEVTATYTAVREADVAASTTTRGLKSAEESYRIRNALFKVGRATSVEMTDAEADLTRARVEAVGARIEQRIARAKLLHAVGRDVPGSGEPEPRPAASKGEGAKVRPNP